MTLDAKPPGPEEMTYASSLVSFLWSWGPPMSLGGAVGFVGAALGAAFRGGRKYGGVVDDLAKHSETLAKYDKRFEALDAARLADAVKLAALPTRNEIADMFGEVREDMRDMREDIRATIHSRQK